MDYNNNPFTSPIFLKSFITLSKSNIKNKLNKINKSETPIEELIYMLSTELLNNNLFFNIKDQSIREWLVYESAHWASKEEAKQKRPKEFSEGLSTKKDKTLTKYTRSIINAIMVNHDINSSDIKNNTIKSIKFNLELVNTLGFLYDISCIKRDRR